MDTQHTGHFIASFYDIESKLPTLRTPEFSRSDAFIGWPIDGLEAMICSSCRRTFLTRIRTLKQTPPSILSASSFRYASTVPSTPNAAPTQPPPAIAVEGANPTQSSSKPGISQPLSEPHTPSTSSATAPPGKETKGPAKVKSSVPGGQELRGLGYTKAHSRILAKEDDEYPDWLWTLLDQNKHAAGEAKVDLSGTSMLFPSPLIHPSHPPSRPP